MKPVAAAHEVAASCTGGPATEHDEQPADESEDGMACFFFRRRRRRRRRSTAPTLSACTHKRMHRHTKKWSNYQNVQFKMVLQ